MTTIHRTIDGIRTTTAIAAVTTIGRAALAIASRCSIGPCLAVCTGRTILTCCSAGGVWCTTLATAQYPGVDHCQDTAACLVDSRTTIAACTCIGTIATRATIAAESTGTTKATGAPVATRTGNTAITASTTRSTIKRT
jgi:hypothetical protein